MTKEKRKSTSYLRNCAIIFFVCQYAQQCSASSEIIGSSVVTSVSVILNAEGRSNKEASLEATTSSPPLPADIEESSGAAPFSQPTELLAADTSAPVTTTVSSPVPTTTTTNRVPSQSPVYIHAQPVVRDDGGEDLAGEEATVSPQGEPGSPFLTSTPLPVSPESQPTESTATTEPTLPPKPTPSTLPPFFKSLLSKSSRRADDDGIRVIDALKDIVRQAQQQHAQNDPPVPAPVTVTLTESGSTVGNTKSGANKVDSSPFGSLPPVAMPLPEDDAPQKIMPGTGMNGDDDDEMEVEVNAGSLDPAASTTDVMNDFAKVVVMVPTEDKSDDEIDAAPSAEVSDAMHKISGAILSSDDVLMQRPVENIVNDVLGSINARNASKVTQQQQKTPTTAAPKTTSTTTSTSTTSTTTTTTTTTTRKPPTTSTTTTPRPTSTRTTTTTTRPTTSRTTTTTPRPTTQVRTTARTTARTTTQPSTTSTTRRTTTTTRRTTTTNLPPRTPPTTTAKPAFSTFLPRITPRITPRTAPTTPRSVSTTTRTTTTRAPVVRTSTTLRPRPPQTTESFPFGSLFNTGLDVKTQQSLANIVKKDKPVMYSPDMDIAEVPPPPYQGAPPPMISTKPPTPSTTTEKPMSALEVMIKQAEQMGRPFTPVVQVSSADVFDPEPPALPIVPQQVPIIQQQQQQQLLLPQSVIPLQQQTLIQQQQQQQLQPVQDQQVLLQQVPTDFRIPGIPVDVSAELSVPDQSGGNDDSTDSSAAGSGNVDAEDNELDLEDSETDTEVEFSTVRPYVPPSKKPSASLTEKRPGNETTSSKRPNEFYDDEIFGFDPYQTFHHGVYVPLVEAIQPLEDQQGSDSSSEEVYVPPPTSKPKRRKRPRPSQPSRTSSNVRPFVKHGKPTKQRPVATKDPKKPVPHLPDYLHRPRPSHLQYQHGAADDTDPLTGLLNANYKHPGESYGPETQTFAPDRLLAIPPQALPQSVRKNLTDHHDHHFQHQHGLVVPGHGHGHGHGDGDAAAHVHAPNAHVPSQASNHLQTADNQPTVAEKRPEFGPAPPGNPGLEATLTSVDPEMRSFVDINNRIALRLFSSLTNPVSKSSTTYGNMVVSPFTITSSLSMLFLGARGNTASQLDGLLRLDDMLTFNPHMMYHNITHAFLSQPNTAAAMIRLLIADKSKGGILDFYRTRVQHFYEARVEQADYKFAGHLAQSIINQMIRAQIQRHSYELLNYSIPLSGPMSMLTAAFFDGQFAGIRDPKVDSMNFIHLAALGRRLFPVPALSVKGNFRAAYDNDLDATAVEVPYTSRDLSLIVMMPGKPGEFSIGGVASLKSKLTLESWTGLMRGFYPREPFKIVLPRFRHQTSVNLTYTLKRFGLTDLFMPDQAQFKGINGLVDLFVDENMMHFSEFATWEKLSDTMRETNMQNNKNLDLIRILRPYVKDQYGQYQEPLSVNDWISMSRNPPAQSQQRSRGPTQPQTMDIRLALRLAHAEEKMKRRQTVYGARSNTNPRIEPMRSFMRPKGKRSKSVRSTSSGRRHQKRHRNNRQKRQLSSRQNALPELEERVLKFERPFIYVLRHNPTGMILMTGQYTEPVTEILQ